MDTRVHIQRGWTVELVTACCPELPGCSATAPNEKLALELLRHRLQEHALRQALAEHALAAAEELARRVAAERAAAPRAMRRPQLHVARVAEPADGHEAADTSTPATVEHDTAPTPRVPPAPSPMRRPSIDHCIASLVHDVLRARTLN